MVKITGKKIGMTQIYTEEGKRCPVTVIETEPSADTKSPEEQFKPGDFVDVSGVSRGMGFQGGMKRWNWSGTPQSHGSMSHRRAGSVGSSAFPSRVFKGKHMPGHMGSQKVTVQNLRVIRLDKENNLLVIKGAVPGHKNSKLVITTAKKKAHLIKKEPPAEPKPEKKVESKAEAKAEKKAEAKPEKKAEAKPEKKAEPKVEAKHEKKAEAKAKKQEKK